MFLFRNWGSSLDSGVGAGHRDVITDFDPASDKIPPAFDTMTDVAGFQCDIAFIGGESFNYQGQARQQFQGGDTLLQINVNGDLAPDFEVLIEGHVFLSADSFM
ncbi:hypothetical protein EU555_26440 [Methylobacterium nonmethylotrophicum]|uniref:Uncharacterized protein n=1 Tax=Methylobacterium nonmethylotrophicum TaxID=1141884 RepID=A0A4Z0NJ70_9HYPH|nr:hypothetical protein [Methylobacterium nonmethylotrophicum]TGD95774.1 hypothetical protein EU555_26440 [Methylobacterium nonmethylotrophicum]